MTEVSKEEWDEWKQHPVTKEFFDKIKEEREGIAKQVLDGAFIGNSQEQDRRVIAVGVYDSILNTEFEDDE